MSNQQHPETELLYSLSGKRFNELSSAEKEFILKHCTEEEFKAVQESTLQIKDLFNSERTVIQSGKNVKEQLMNRFRQKKKSLVSGHSWIELILNYRIPAYQPALVFILVLAMYLLTNKPVSPADKTYLALDTSSRTSVVSNSELAVKQIYSDTLPVENIKVETSTKESTLNSQAKKITIIQPGAVPDVFDFKEEQVNGRSLRDDTLLSVFFVSPN